MPGVLSEYALADAKLLARKPGNISMLEAASLPLVGITSWNALIDRANIKAGQKVLVHAGTGGVGHFALQLAKCMGAKVIATSSSEEKLAKLKELGADELINYKEHPEWGKEVLKITNNEGVDHVMEVGGGGTFGESVRAAKLGGHIALIGVLSGPAVSEIILPRIFLKQVRLSGIAMANQQSQIAMIEFIEKHNIKPIISDTFDLANLSDAFQHQIDNKHFGKISITMGAE